MATYAPVEQVAALVCIVTQNVFGAGVELLLWAPRPARGAAVDPSMGAVPGQSAAAWALAAYNQHFSQLIESRPQIQGLSQAFQMACWTAFMSRWLAAAVAAVKVRASSMRSQLPQ